MWKNETLLGQYSLNEGTNPAGITCSKLTKQLLE